VETILYIFIEMSRGYRAWNKPFYIRAWHCFVNFDLDLTFDMKVVIVVYFQTFSFFLSWMDGQTTDRLQAIMCPATRGPCIESVSKNLQTST